MDVNKKHRNLIIKVILVVVFSVSVIFLGMTYFTSYHNNELNNGLKRKYTVISTKSVGRGEENWVGVEGILSKEEDIFIDFEGLEKENPDVVGWLRIKGSNINYPVVQSKTNDEYLNKGFDGKRSSVGTLFVDAGNTILGNSEDDVTVIYGHNMGYGREDMFGELLKYKDEDWYNGHKDINFITKDGVNHKYGVFAVVEADIMDGSNNPFYINKNGKRYDRITESEVNISEEDLGLWYYTLRMPQAEKDNYVERLKKVALRSEQKAETGNFNSILMLSTCDRSVYGKYGRLLVFAEEIV